MVVARSRASLALVALGSIGALGASSSVPRASAEDAAPTPSPSSDDGPSLTVYSSADPAGFDAQQFISQQRAGYSPNYAWQVPGFGVVRETRKVTVPKGIGDLQFTDVAEFVDPTTVSFADLTDPAGTAVVEQTFRFDLTSPDKLLERYLGKEIGLELLKDSMPVGRTSGTVLSVNQGQVVLKTPEGIRFVGARDPGLRLPSLPEGLLSRPTLVWKVASESGGEHRVQTTYQTAGITWRADYNLVVDATDKKADLGAWVTMLNVSGAGWKNARLKLIAGDVQRVQASRLAKPTSSGGSTRSGFDGPAGFEEKAFFEYHLYTLPRRTDVLANQTQQIALFPTAHDVGVEKALVYYGLPESVRWNYTPTPRIDRDIRTASNTKVDVYLRFKNSKDNHLGMPMPRGKVRVYKRDDADGSLEFVGEDLIDHTPKDETLLVKVGQSFDVVGDRKQTTFDAPSGRDEMSEGFRIVLRNHKDADVKVSVRENLFRWLNWEITSESEPHTKLDARTIHFDVVVPANGEKVVTYTVRYSW